MPRRQLRLPQAVLTLEEVERILAVPDVSHARSACATAPSSRPSTRPALRRSELRRLHLDDLQLNRGVLFVRQGKGGQGPLRADRGAGHRLDRPSTCAKAARSSRRRRAAEWSSSPPTATSWRRPT